MLVYILLALLGAFAGLRRTMIEKAVFVFSSISFLSSTYVLSQLPPTLKTTLKHYTTGVHWNAANDFCNAEGGRLLQFENSRKNGYSTELLEKISEESSVSEFKAWIGMVNTRDEENFVWTDGCVEVCYYDWGLFKSWDSWSRSTGSCGIVSYKGWDDYSGRSNINDDICDKSHDFICEHNLGTPCDYTVNNDKTLRVRAYADSDILSNVTETDCENSCNIRTKFDNECWGFNYISRYSKCKLIYTYGPFDLTNDLYNNLGAVSKIKSCFEFVSKPDPIGMTFVSSTEPQTPCFENQNMIDCPDWDTMDDDYSTTFWTQTMSLDDQGKPSSKSTSILPLGTSETTTTNWAKTTSVDDQGQPSSKSTSILPFQTSETTTTNWAKTTSVDDQGQHSSKSTSILPFQTSETTTTNWAKTTPVDDQGQPSSKSTSILPFQTSETTTTNWAKTTPVDDQGQPSSKSTSILPFQTSETRSVNKNTIGTWSTAHHKTELSTEIKTTETTSREKTVQDSSESSDAISLTTQATTTTTLEDDCVCWCVRLRIPKQNVSKEVFTKKLIEGLEIDKQNLSSSVRKKVSIYERQTVSVALGSIWIGILLGIYGVVFLSDVLFAGRTKSPTKVKAGEETPRVLTVTIE